MTYNLKPFNFNLSDLNFIRDQIKFRPLFDAAGNAIVMWDGTGDVYDAAHNQYATTGDAAANIALWGTSYSSLTASEGLRDVSGLNNNLLLVNSAWGSVNQPFMQRMQASFDNYVQAHHVGDIGSFYANNFAGREGLINGATTDYTKTSTHPGDTPATGNIVDYTPRMISELVTTADASFTLVSGHTTKDANGFTAVDNYGMLETLGQQDKQNADNHEFFIGAINPGIAPANGWLALFGQFFDHGLDFIGKGQQGTTIKIPLATTDPMYGVIDPTSGRPATTITISRANVSGFDAAGNAQWLNHSSPYIDQSQTYGSSDQVTQLLRKWISTDGGLTYHAGAGLLDGATSKEWVNAFGEPTKATLPTLNELRAALLATGRDALTWTDVLELRNRDASGHVTDGSSGQALLLDMNPNFNTAHFSGATIQALSDLGIEPDGSGNYATGGPPGSMTLGNIIDFRTFGPMAGGTPQLTALAGEVLMEAVGDHYIAGDGRVNENIGLTTIHHVFHEEHNFQVRNIETAILAQIDRAITLHTSPNEIIQNWQDVTDFHDAKGNYLLEAGGEIAWNGDKVFAAAKLTVEMEYQHVAVDQYARSITPDLPEFVGYNSGENATISLDYAQVAFRFGHSTLRESIDLIDPDGGITGKVMAFALEKAFLNPALFAEKGAAAIALGMTHQQMNEVDEFITPALNQGLLGQPLDLAAINIARGRDIGIPTLNEFRAAINLTTYNSWSDFGANMIHPDNLVNFIAAYSFDGDKAKALAIVGLDSGLLMDGDVGTYGVGGDGVAWSYTVTDAVDFLNGGDTGYDHIDTWLGGLAEAHVLGGLLGETFNAVFLDQINRLMDGDRFYYLYRLNNMNLGDEIANAQFKDIIERNTGLEHLNGSAFSYADQYFDLARSVDPLNSTGSFKTDHKYADVTAAGSLAIADGHNGENALGAGYGIYTHTGTSTNGNGSLIKFGGITYINDVRAELPANTPNLTGVNLDGTADSGTSSNEVLVGSDNRDLIYMYGGDDTAYGEGGNDIIYGGSGVDRLYGGDGNDVIYGGDGPDLIDGGAGDDILWGESSASAMAGVDQIIGGDGNDIIHGGVGIDKLSGGRGDDVIFGEGDTDAFTHGGDGNDYMDGGSDGDLLWGDDGDDLIVGGNNQDILGGLDGDDILRPGNPSSAGGGGPDEVMGGDGVSDAGNGGKGVGFDLIDFSDYFASTTGVTADLTTQANPAGAINPNSTFPAWFGIEGIIGSRNNDTELGDDNNNWLIGGSGNDTLRGGAGFDLLIGDGIRLDSLIGTYFDKSTQLVADIETTVLVADTYTSVFDGATHRVEGGAVLGSNGLLDAVGGGGFDKHFTEMLKSEMFKNLELGSGGTQNLIGGGTTGDGGTAGSADVAVFSGSIFDYTFSAIRFEDAHGNIIKALVVKDNVSGRDGTDLLVGIEKANFADATNVTILGAINNAPIGSASALLADGTEDISYTVTAAQLLAGFVDVDGDALSITGLAAGANGTVVDNGDATFTITPTANYNGTVNLTYNVIDGNGGSIAGAQHFILAAVNDATLGEVTINNTAPELLTTLTASNTLTDVDGVIYPINYQWQSSTNGTTWTNLSVGTNYTTTAANAGQQIRVVESYRVGSLTAPIETVASTPTLPVDNFVTITGTNGADLVAALSPLAANLALNHHIYGWAGNDTIAGGNGNDLLDGGANSDTVSYANALAGVTVDLAVVGAQNTIGAGTDTLLNFENITGSTFVDTLRGDTGNNILNGNGGLDTLIGGAGSDTYVLDAAVQTITENSGDVGIDLVQSSLASYTLANNVENLTLTGTGNISGTGNAQDNIITGNTGTNTLNGGNGNDTLVATVDKVRDTLNGGNNTDTADYSAYTAGLTVNLGGGGTIVVTGSGLTNANSDVLVSIENFTGGSGTDNITGSSSDNVLNAGTAGNDTLTGGAGNDTYIVDHTGVTIIEAGSGGTDTVQSSVTTTLSNNVENLTLTNAVAPTPSVPNPLENNINGTGNASNNVITGNDGNNTLNGLGGTDILVGGAGADILNGGAGKDTLTGGTGNDTFVFGQTGATVDTSNVLATRDIITDFTAGDKIDLTGIDANTVLAGIQGFSTSILAPSGVGGITPATFTAAGQLRYYYSGADTIIEGNLNTSPASEFQIQLSGIHYALGDADFVL